MKLFVEIELPDGHAVSRVLSKPAHSEAETHCRITRTAFASLAFQGDRLVLLEEKRK